MKWQAPRSRTCLLPRQSWRVFEKKHLEDLAFEGDAPVLEMPWLAKSAETLARGACHWVEVLASELCWVKSFYFLQPSPFSMVCVFTHTYICKLHSSQRLSLHMNVSHVCLSQLHDFWHPLIDLSHLKALGRPEGSLPRSVSSLIGTYQPFSINSWFRLSWKRSLGWY